METDGVRSSRSVHGKGQRSSPAADSDKRDHAAGTERSSEHDASQPALSAFFQRWSRPVDDLTECLPDAELFLVAKEADPAKWPSHAQNCEQCREVIDLLNRPDRVKIPISQILSMSSSLANKEVHRSHKRRFRSRAYLGAFYNSFRPSQTLAVGLALILLFSVATLLYLKRALNTSEQSYIVTLPEDNYWRTVEWLRQANMILGDPNLASRDKLVQLKPLKNDQEQIKQMLAQINPNDLGNKERTEFAEQLAFYNTQMQILKNPSQLPTKSNDEAEQITAVAQTNDSKIVTQVWAAFSTPSLKNEALWNADEKDIETALGIVEASKQTDVTSINDKKEVWVLDLVDRNEADKIQIEKRIEQLKTTQGVSVSVSWSSSNHSTLPHYNAVSPRTIKYPGRVKAP